jgi:hypothetical protein
VRGDGDLREGVDSRCYHRVFAEDEQSTTAWVDGWASARDRPPKMCTESKCYKYMIMYVSQDSQESKVLRRIKSPSDFARNIPHPRPFIASLVNLAYLFCPSEAAGIAECFWSRGALYGIHFVESLGEGGCSVPFAIQANLSVRM